MLKVLNYGKAERFKGETKNFVGFWYVVEQLFAFNIGMENFSKDEVKDRSQDHAINPILPKKPHEITFLYIRSLLI